MSINFNQKIEDINIFLNKQYFPLLKEYGITDDELQEILQNIVNKIDGMKEKLDEFDTEDYGSLIDLATNGGIVYKDENGTQFEDINEALINTTIGSMAALCKKNGVPMNEYSIGNPNVLPTEAEEKVSKLDSEDFKMFFKGDSLGFYNKYGNGQKKTSKDELEEIKQRLLKETESSEVVDPETKFVVGSDEYNNTHYPKKTL